MIAQNRKHKTSFKVLTGLKFDYFVKRTIQTI